MCGCVSVCVYVCAYVSDACVHYGPGDVHACVRVLAQEARLEAEKEAQEAEDEARKAKEQKERQWTHAHAAHAHACTHTPAQRNVQACAHTHTRTPAQWKVQACAHTFLRRGLRMENAHAHYARTHARMHACPRRGGVRRLEGPD